MGETMRAAVFHGRGDVRVELVPVPVASAGELLVRVDAVGICGTDAHEFHSGPHMFPITTRHAVSGHLGPMIPGHELTGTVVSVAEGVHGFAVGDRVVSGAGVSCGTCHWCLRGRTNLCQSYQTVGLQRDGGLAQFVAVPASTCIGLGPYGLPADVAALGQPMSIAVHAMRRGRLTSDDVAVVVGAGGIGAFLVFVAVQLGATVVVSDIDAERLEIARSMGAQHVVHPGDGGSIAATLEGHALIPSVVYEVSGTPVGLANALEVAPRGCRVVLVGLQGSPAQIDVRDVSLREIELIGTNAHAVGSDMPEALRLLTQRPQGWRDIAPTALSLDDLVEEGLIPLAERRSTRVKTLIDPWTATTRETTS